MRSISQVLRPALAVAVVLAALASCRDADGDKDGRRRITMWTLEDLGDRVETQRQILADFTAKTGVSVRLVRISEDDFDEKLTGSAAVDELPDVIAAIPLASVHMMHANDLLDIDSPGAIVDTLGRDTFTDAALDLVTDRGKVLAAPSDSWRQLLIYRKDLFDRAGLPAPDTYENIARAAAALHRDGLAGIVAGTDPAASYTQQSFELFALANGCELTDESGSIALASRACAEAFAGYAGLMREHSVPGNQTAETTRATYFAGQAAMIVWSSFLLDELAGLRNDALPTCPQCRHDRAYLAKHSGVVTSLTGPSGDQPASFGEVVSWAVTAGAATGETRKLIEYMMSDGYLRWLAMAPEGKLPTRTGVPGDLRRYTDAWSQLEVGINAKKPLSQVYDQSVLDAVAANPGGVDRWASAKATARATARATSSGRSAGRRRWQGR